MKVVVRGKKWDLRFTRVPNDADGFCDPPTATNKRIRISHSLKDEALLNTTIHELLHAAMWDHAEEAVNETATDIANVLWRLGYRKT